MDTTLACEGERLSGGIVLITVSGELDITTADELRRLLATLLAQGPIDKLVVDLSGVTFLDSSGIGVLVGSQRLTEPPVHLVATRPEVLRPLHLTNLDKVFVVSDSRDQALEAAAQDLRQHH